MLPVRRSWQLDPLLLNYSQPSLVNQSFIVTIEMMSFSRLMLFSGIFVAKGDVGVGTIVGSAVFNIVCVIGVCGLFVNSVSDREQNRIGSIAFVSLGNTINLVVSRSQI